MSSSRFTLDSPQNNFQSGSGFAYVHSRGGALEQVIVACGSVKGTVAFYQSTSAHASTQRAFIRAQVNTTGNPTGVAPDGTAGEDEPHGQFPA